MESSLPVMQRDRMVIYNNEYSDYLFCIKCDIFPHHHCRDAAQHLSAQELDASDPGY